MFYYAYDKKKHANPLEIVKDYEKLQIQYCNM